MSPVRLLNFLRFWRFHHRGSGDREQSPDHAKLTNVATPVRGESAIQWSKAIEIPFSPDQLPTWPAALAVRLLVECGYAAVGWYDDDGLAEEIIVGPGPCSPRVHLSLWNPGLCRSLIIRSAAPELLHVSLVDLAWQPLRKALASNAWPRGLGGVGEGMLLDLPFRGTLAEALWRNGHVGSYEPSLRLRRLRKLVSLAWERCPGYRNWWLSNGWHPSELRTLADAADIPVVSKDHIRSDLQGFSLPRAKSSLSSTTGSTGEPFTFRYTASLRAAHQAALAIAASHLAPDLPPWEMRFAVLRGRQVRGLSGTGAGGSLVMSPSITRDPDAIRRLLDAYKPHGLFAWPSAAAALADALGDAFRFRGAIIASEQILPAQLQAIEKITEGIVVTYGLSEGAVFAQRCPSCGTYGELAGLGVANLLARPDGLFDIVGTSFWSLSTLFISYNTGDVATGATNGCPRCPMTGGISFSDVKGRAQDSVTDRYGRRHTLGLLLANRAVSASMANIRLFDCVQDRAGRLLLRYIGVGGQPLDESAVLRAFRHVVPDLELRLQFEPQLLAIRDGLPRGAKWKLLKSTC